MNEKPRRITSPAKHVATLRRRMEHLTKRVAGQPLDAMSYHRAERAAPWWAIELPQPSGTPAPSEREN